MLRVENPCQWLGSAYLSLIHVRTIIFFQIDLSHLESLIDERTRAIVINNPSNPCGSVFDDSHLREILDIAEKHWIPIIADEVSTSLVLLNMLHFYALNNGEYV